MAGKKGSKKVTCEIKEIYTVLSDGISTKKVFGSFSWNGREPKNEIRTILKMDDGSECVTKGISLSELELDRLITAAKKLKTGREKKNEESSAPTHPSAVNLDEIFHDASDIIQKRSNGCLTEDGFIVLERKRH